MKKMSWYDSRAFGKSRPTVNGDSIVFKAKLNVVSGLEFSLSVHVQLQESACSIGDRRLNIALPNVLSMDKRLDFLIQIDNFAVESVTFLLKTFDNTSQLLIFV